MSKSTRSTRRASRRVLMAIALAAAPLSWTQATWAQTSIPGVAVDDADAKQKADATRAYKAGVEAMEKTKDHGAALARFQESYAIVASPNTHLMIVRALVASQRWLEAYREAEAAASEAQKAAAQDPKYQSAVSDIATEMQNIKQQVAFVTVEVGDAPEDASLTVAGNEIDREQWGQPIAVEAGEVQVVLTGPDGDKTQSVQAAAGNTTEVSFAAASAPPPPRPVAKPAPVLEAGYSGPDRRILAIGAGAVGVLGFVGFGAFGLLANAQFDRLDSGCRPDPEYCNPDLEGEASKGRRYQAVANAGLAIGLIGIAAGAGLFVWDMLDPAGGDHAAEGARIRMGVGAGSLAVDGTF